MSAYPRWEGKPGSGRLLWDEHTTFDFGPDRPPLYKMVEMDSNDKKSVLFIMMGFNTCSWVWAESSFLDKVKNLLAYRERMSDDLLDRVLAVEAPR